MWETGEKEKPTPHCFLKTTLMSALYMHEQAKNYE